MLLGVDLDIPQFDLQAGPVGVEEFEIAHHAAVVTLAGQFGGRGRGGEGFAERGGLLGSITDLREGGFHVFDGGQHRLAVIGYGFFARCFCLTNPRGDETVASQRQAHARSEGPRAAVKGEEAVKVAAKVTRYDSKRMLPGRGG